MSRSHKERHRWKSKERKRTGERDPEKIALHRERFIKRQEQKAAAKYGYDAAVYRARLVYFSDEVRTELHIDGEKAADLPFLADDPESCHYAVAEHWREFDPVREAEILRKHVQKMKFTGGRCHLAEERDEALTCSSIMRCAYRRWIAEKGMPACALHG